MGFKRNKGLKAHIKTKMTQIACVMSLQALLLAAFWHSVRDVLPPPFPPSLTQVGWMSCILPSPELILHTNARRFNEFVYNVPTTPLHAAHNACSMLQSRSPYGPAAGPCRRLDAPLKCSCVVLIISKNVSIGKATSSVAVNMMCGGSIWRSCARSKRGQRQSNMCMLPFREGGQQFLKVQFDTPKNRE